ncbi:uncharacterized protein [Euwallacea similis]|uniref:uncharacterized protein n=1 Tax=Euwallacea similis TaxID=1736056 RepID=UPI00345045FC
MKKQFDKKRKENNKYSIDDLVLWRGAKKDSKVASQNDRYEIVSLKGIKGYPRYSAVVAADAIRDYKSGAIPESDMSSDSEFTEIQDNIESACESAELEKEYEERADFENRYYFVISLAQKYLDEIKTDNEDGKSSSKNSQKSVNLNTVKAVKLPDINLPIFDGSLQNWFEFRDTFESLIHKNEALSDIQRFHYLRASVCNEPLQIVSTVEFYSDNYTTAWELVGKLYNKDKLLTHYHIKNVFNVETISKESAKDIRMMLTNLTKNMRALNKMGLPTASWDVPMVYMLSTKLDKGTTREWESFKSKSKIYPSLEDFKLFLSDKAEFLENMEPSRTERQQAGKFKGDKLPILKNTRLGWIVTGPVGKENKTEVVNCNFSSTETSFEQQIYESLKRFWEIENISGVKRGLSEEELACEELFKKNTTRCEDGSFVVRLPLKLEVSKLGSSFEQAKRRFLNLERKMCSNEQYKKLYHDFIKEYIKLGHMTKDTSLDQSLSGHYFMCHHGLYRADAITTNLRVVFDASLPSCTGFSLNNIQMAGPTIQQDLFSILIRFRQHRCVVSADCTKMYRSVWVHPDERPLQRILWRFSPEEPLHCYQLKTLTYGTTSASFLAIRCLFQLALEIQNTYPDIAEVIKNDFYVDDLLTGANTVAESRRICKLVFKTLKQGCFVLRKFCANDGSILDGIPNDDSLSKIVEFGENDAKKTLGLIWNPIHDILMYKGLWLEKLSWDDPVPCDIAMARTTFASELRFLNELRLGRHAIGENAKSIEMHCFSDSSERAYGACIYLRSLNENGETNVCLLASKAKVAPLQTVTLPRLELCGALVASRLAKKISQSLRLKLEKICNRVAEIQENTSSDTWRHVPSQLNPADYLSRGLRCSEIKNVDVWWNGPRFLCLPETEWPKTPGKSDELPDLRKTRTYCANNTLQGGDLHTIVARVQVQEDSFYEEFESIKGNKLKSSSKIISLKPFIDEFGLLRAVHLELVTDLSKESFILSLRRFVARRGKPSAVYSDNGTNFVSAHSELKDLGQFIIQNNDELTSKLCNEGIELHFIPPQSPHFDGLWEAGVKSMKFHLKRVVSNTPLTFEYFYTLLSEVEAIINSRPLSPLSFDPEDLTPLTPGHLLIGRQLSSWLSADLRSLPTNRLSLYQHLQQLRQHIWSRWSKEYVVELQQRIKWRQNYDNLTEGSLVLVKDDNAPPMR